MATWTPAYLTEKQDIIDWVSDQRRDLTTGDIPDVLLHSTDVIIWAMLEEANIQVNYTGTETGHSVDPADIRDYLWAASLAFTLEQLSTRGTIIYTHGGVEQTKFGQVTHRFMRMQPMFFIPRGTESVDHVMPFRSYKQIGQQFVKAYIQAYLQNTKGYRVAAPQVGFDMTARGYGWNAGSGFMIIADNLSLGMR